MFTVFNYLSPNNPMCGTGENVSPHACDHMAVMSLDHGDAGAHLSDGEVNIRARRGECKSRISTGDEQQFVFGFEPRFQIEAFAFLGAAILFNCFELTLGHLSPILTRACHAPLLSPWLRTMRPFRGLFSAPASLGMSIETLLSKAKLSNLRAAAKQERENVRNDGADAELKCVTSVLRFFHRKPKNA